MHDILAAQLADHVGAANAAAPLLPRVAALGERLCRCFAAGGRLYTFGNGGSAADAQHLAAEMIGRYKRERRPLPAVALTVDPSVVSCIGNDYDFDDVFARQVRALATPTDVVIGFTTSGNSPNVVRGLAAAREAGAAAVLFTGARSGAAEAYADEVVRTPSDQTARTQEMHLLLLHLLSEWVDAWAAGETDERGNRLAAADTHAGGGDGSPPRQTAQTTVSLVSAALVGSSGSKSVGASAHAEPAGTGRPSCRHAAGVATRPRGVRTR